MAVSRVLTRSGRWLILHGITLEAGPERRVAVIIEPADPARIAPLLMSAYGLTDREQELTRLVLQGLSTSEIAAELVISVHTVQQHLKNVFDKTGVRSRRELVTKIFLRHYEPRLRDNERRTEHRLPTRGGPFPATVEIDVGVMSLRGFATLNIWADDVPAAAAWYAEFLGIEPYFSRPGPDGIPRRTWSSGSATRPTNWASSAARTRRQLRRRAGRSDHALACR